MHIFCDFFMLWLVLLKIIKAEKELCGSSKTVEIGTKTVEHFPWIGAIFDKTNGTSYICGATLITKLYAVSAGHCIHDKKSDHRRTPYSIELRFGFRDLKNFNESGSDKAHVKEISVATDWDPMSERYDSDISVLQLMKPIEFTKTISPICLWPVSARKANYGTVISWTNPMPGDPGTWDFDFDSPHNYPATYIMPIRSNDFCLAIQPRFVAISSIRTFCGGGLNTGACLETGNSGASMAIKEDDRYFLRGIVSASFIDIAGCDNYTFTLFTDVLKHQSFIMDLIKEL